MGVRIKTTSGPAIERPGDMVATLTQLQKDDILFVDEVHRLSRVVEEVLYPAMEDFFVSWVIDKGLKARSMNLSVKPFTMVAATTRYGMVSSPLRDRFGTVHRLEFYDNESMRIIVERSARILKIEAEPGGVAELAQRARGTPRIANRLLKRVRDYAQVMADNVVTRKVTVEALSRLEVDDLGLDKIDHQGARIDRGEVLRRTGGTGHAGRVHQRGPPTPSRTCASRTCCNWDSWNAHPAAGSPPPAPTSTSASNTPPSHRPRRACSRGFLPGVVYLVPDDCNAIML